MQMLSPCLAWKRKRRPAREGGHHKSRNPWQRGGESPGLPCFAHMARSLSSLWKENLNLALFVSPSLGVGLGFHGNWPWTLGRSHPAASAHIFLCLVHLWSPPTSPSCVLGRGRPRIGLRSLDQVRRCALRVISLSLSPGHVAGCLPRAKPLLPV